MPYLTDEEKARLNPLMEPIRGQIATPGQLNYVICRLFVDAVRQQYDLSYTRLSAFHAGVQDAADEIYRRVLGEYENEARLKNGDVFDDILTEIYNKYHPEAPL